MNVYAVFHLNLAFSSIDQECHKDIVTACYVPILDCIEYHGIPLAIEITAFTLDAIHVCSPSWIERLKRLVHQGHCELLASGDSQLIGPLVPAKLNQANLALGLEAYEKYLNYRPRIAYVNEQAVSNGLLDVYIDFAFEAIMIEWDNPYSYNPLWKKSDLNGPGILLSARGRTIKVLWNQAIAFQKLQRLSHGEISSSDYFEFLESSAQEGRRSLCLYGSDAEIFDFRPGRYSYEEKSIGGEWEVLLSAFDTIAKSIKFHWIRPSECLDDTTARSPLAVCSAAHPISVKKQAKYNVTRWALSGRNDLALNTFCFSRFKAIDDKQNSYEEYKDLCRLWSSDFRTHLTKKRYEKIIHLLPAQDGKRYADQRQESRLQSSKLRSPVHASTKDENRYLVLRNSTLTLTLNTRRGLAIESLTFKKQIRPVLGTLRHGHFDHIGLGADFYSNHMVIERFKERDRVTDLTKNSFNLYEEIGFPSVVTNVETAIGQVRKTYTLYDEKIECSFEFENMKRPESSFRLGFLTLMECHQRAWFACHNGGPDLELFECFEDVNHGQSVSSLVSSRAACGATEGVFYFGSGEAGVKLSWSQGNAAPLPMVSSQRVGDLYLNRAWLSLVESDETLKEGGSLRNIAFTLEPINKVDLPFSILK